MLRAERLLLPAETYEGRGRKGRKEGREGH